MLLTGEGTLETRRLLVFFLGFQAVLKVEGICQIESQRCNFPFTYEGKKFTYCTEHNATEGQFVCVSKHGEDLWSWGVCQSGCLEDDGELPKDFGGEMAGMAVFCKVEPLPCVFPFNFNGVEYNECTEDDMGFPWCATHVNEDGSMIDNMWGKCDVESCTEKATVLPQIAEEEADPKTALVSIDTGDVMADLKFEQENPKAPLNLVGTVSGLSPGLHGIVIHSGHGDNCSDVGPHYNPLNKTHGGLASLTRHTGDLGNIEVGEDGIAEINFTIEGTSLYEPYSVINRVLVIYEGEDDLTESEEDTFFTPSACGIIYEESEWPLILIIIITLAIAIVLLLILITILICCCMKRKKPEKNLEKTPDEEELPLHNGNGTYCKKPLYDELSIPFIDATPAPTPKLGRSIDRLSSFFTRNPSVGRSRGSLASMPPPAYPPPEVPDNETPWKGSRRLRKK